MAVLNDFEVTFKIEVLVALLKQGVVSLLNCNQLVNLILLQLPPHVLPDPPLQEELASSIATITVFALVQALLGLLISLLKLRDLSQKLCNGACSFLSEAVLPRWPFPKLF